MNKELYIAALAIVYEAVVSKKTLRELIDRHFEENDYTEKEKDYILTEVLEKMVQISDRSIV